MWDAVKVKIKETGQGFRKARSLGAYLLADIAVLVDEVQR
jgi:hypothetical protein